MFDQLLRSLLLDPLEPRMFMKLMDSFATGQKLITYYSKHLKVYTILWQTYVNIKEQKLAFFVKSSKLMDDVIAKICVKFKERMVYCFRTHVNIKNKTSQLVMKKEK